jgi:hypothetical protein
MAKLTFKQRLRQLKNKLLKTNRFPVQPQHTYEWAFTVGGYDYYMFSDPFNIPSQRALAAIDFYNELQMGVDKEFLQLHCDAIEKEVNKGNLARIAELNSQLKERAESILNAELLYKLASVIFFSAEENPYEYSFEQAYKKIELWKQHSEAIVFFYKTGILELVPLPNSSKIDTQGYLKAQIQHEGKTLDSIMQTLSSKEGNSEPEQIITSRMAALRNIKV